MSNQTRIVWGVILLALAIVHGAALADSSVVRLHVVANSNSQEDQGVKEQVRDRLVKELGPQFATMEQAEVEKWLTQNQDVLSRLAAEVVAESGKAYPVNVKLGVEKYPTRIYGGIAYPAGRYKSVRVILGAGQGKNWWCLLFPPLCFADETVARSIEDGQSDQVELKFWVVEKIRALINRWRN